MSPSSDDDLFDILADEFALRVRNGESPAIEEYARLHPTIAMEIRELFPAIWVVEAGLPGQERASGYTASEAVNDFPGTTRFELIRELGAGGMGVVYEAHDRETNLRVALKLLPSAHPPALLRFKREFRLLTDLVHPNLVSLYELHSDGQRWFFTMELIEGTNFKDWLQTASVASSVTGCLPIGQSHQPFSAERRHSSAFRRDQHVRDAFRQLAIAIQFLHSHGRLHRDIKFSNVMVRRNGTIVLLDFGLVSLQDTQSIPSGNAALSLAATYVSERSVVAGSPLFMAPEQAAGCSLTPACDWYAFGVMLYEVLTGRLPFSGHPSEVMRRKQAEDPVPPQQLVAGLPADLCDLCAQLVQRAADQRPSGDRICRVFEGMPRCVDVSRTSDEVPYPRRDLATRLAQTDTADTPLETVFVGRQEPLVLLLNAFESMKGGQPLFVSVRGASGLGKTALVQTFLTHLIELNACIVLSGSCYERELVPFKAIDALMDALCGLLLRMRRHDAEELLPPDFALLCRAFPVLNRAVFPTTGARVEVGGTEAAELRRRAFNALWELLKRLGARQPLVLAVDDLHWADEDSLGVLADLLCMRDPPRMFVLVTYRSELAANFQRLRELVSVSSGGGAAFTAVDIVLQPLNHADARELALRHLTHGSRGQTLACAVNRDASPKMQGDVNTEPHSEHGESLGVTDRDSPADTSMQAANCLAEAIAFESQGHPYFVQELVRHASAANARLPVRSSSGTVDLDEALWLRVMSLPDEARRLVEVSAVCGRPLRVDVAHAASRVSDPAGRAVARVRFEHLLRTSGPTGQDTVEPYHDRVRESVLAHLTREAQRALHASLAEALEQYGDFEPESLAVHLQHADQPTRAAQFYALAADAAAASLAFERAADLYRLSIRLQSPDRPHRTDLQQRLAAALADAGRGGDAAIEYLSAASGESQGESLRLRRRAARQFCISGHTDEGRRLFRGILQDHGIPMRSHPTAIVMSLVWQRLRLKLRGLQCTASQGEEFDDGLLEQIDLLWDAASGLSFQEPAVVASLHTRGLLLALKAGEPKRLVRSLSWEAALCATAGTQSTGRVESLIRAASGLAEGLHDAYSSAMLHLAQGMAAFLHVRMPQAVPSLLAAEKIFAAAPSTAWYELATSRLTIVWALMHMGEFLRLETYVSEYTHEAQSRGDRFVLTSIGSAGRPQLLLAADRVDDSARELQEVIDRYPFENFQQQHVSLLFTQAQLDLYRGDGAAAYQRFLRNWSSLRKSLQLRNQFARVSMLDLRARSALLVARQRGDRRMLREVRRIAAQLHREPGDWVRPYASRLRAGIAEIDSDQQTAVAELKATCNGFDSIGFHLCAASAKRRVGQLLGASEGALLVMSAEEVLSSQGIRRPDRYQAMCLYE